MPLIFDSPVPERDAPVADLFEVTGVNVRVVEGTVTITWRKRLRGQSGAPAEVAAGSHVVPAGLLRDLRPDGSKTYNENLKELAYGLLREAGVFPEGGSLS